LSKIHLLDNLTANQIAAGEVIERPASVVKELIENSIDAGACNITVAIQQGGLKQLRIQDDGSGMSKEDALLSVKRHATSKLKVIDDLNTLATLGFRGEALPSIVSVAKVEIVSRESGVDYGTKLLLEGNALIGVEPVGTPAGTAITVSDLFYNIPARKKFMRSAGYEAGLIHELLIHFSLSHPQINFRLFHDGSELLNTAGVNSVPDLLELFYGHNARGSLIELEAVLTEGEISGYLTLPTYHRVNRKGIHFFINSRKVIAKELMLTLTEAYENVMPKGRSPLAVFHIRLDPALIDVNVHPSKLEIRFRDLAIVRELAQLFKETLQRQKTVPLYQPSNLYRPFDFPAAIPAGLSESSPAGLPLSAPADFPVSVQESFGSFDIQASQQLRPSNRQSILQPPPNSAQQQEPVIKTDATIQNDATLQTVETAVALKASSLPELRIIGQLAATFILAEAAGELYIIDQHVAHERIIFEQLKQQASSGSVDSQLLLHPVPLQFTALEEELVIQHILPLTEFGIILEHFGPRSYLLRAVPTCLTGEPEDFFQALLQQLTNTNKKLSLTDIKQEYLIMASCKGAIKANQALSPEEMNKLVCDLRASNNLLTCPHGRPIIYHIPHKDILKAFHRN